MPSTVPSPQTKFVLTKALEAGLKPVVVINKVDRPNARPHQVVVDVFELLFELGADDHTLDFKTIFCSGREGWAITELHDKQPIPTSGDLRRLRLRDDHQGNPGPQGQPQ